MTVMPCPGGRCWSCGLFGVVSRQLVMSGVTRAGAGERDLREGEPADAGTRGLGEELRDPLPVVLQFAVTFGGGLGVDVLDDVGGEVFRLNGIVAVREVPSLKDGDKFAALRVGSLDLGYAVNRVTGTECKQGVAAPLCPHLIGAQRLAVRELGLPAPAPDGQRRGEQRGP